MCTECIGSNQEMSLHPELKKTLCPPTQIAIKPWIRERIGLANPKEWGLWTDSKQKELQLLTAVPNVKSGERLQTNGDLEPNHQQFPAWNPGAE